MSRFGSLLTVLSIFTAQFAVAELLIDTGPGNDLGIVINGSFGTNRLFAAAQVDFESSVHVDDVSVHILVQGQFLPENNMTVSITNDDGSNVPGSDVLASVTMMIDGVFFIRWVDFTGFDVNLAQGSYWVTVTVDDTSQFNAALAINPPMPLDHYAIFTEATGQWSPLTPPPAFPLRVEGEPLLDDLDDDGIIDAEDNCIEIANPVQRDTDADGFGNQCDPDFNNDGIVNFVDTTFWVSQFNTVTNGDADLNGDGIANFLDYYRFSTFFLLPPGPSGLAN